MGIMRLDYRKIKWNGYQGIIEEFLLLVIILYLYCLAGIMGHLFIMPNYIILAISHGSLPPTCTN